MAREQVGPWWVFEYPSQKDQAHYVGKQPKVTCPRCGARVSKYQLSHHQSYKACQRAYKRKQLGESGWYRLPRNGMALQRAGVEVLYDAGVHWAPRWAAVALHSMRAMRFPSSVQRHILNDLNNRHDIQEIVAENAVTKKYRGRYYPLVEVSLLLTYTKNTKVMDLLAEDRNHRFRVRQLIGWMRSCRRWLETKRNGSLDERLQIVKMASNGYSVVLGMTRRYVKDGSMKSKTADGLREKASDLLDLVFDEFHQGDDGKWAK